MTDPPTDDTEIREPDAPDPTGSESHTPRHGHTGGVHRDKAHSPTPVCRPAPQPRQRVGGGRDQRVGGGRDLGPTEKTEPRNNTTRRIT
eukprot:scaffold24178_cov100-Isochrysis_galbana.AAC.1